MNRGVWHLIDVRIATAIFLLVASLALFAPGTAAAQTFLSSFKGGDAKRHTQVSLLLSAETGKPGDTVWAGVDMKMDPGWHTYWKNAGDAGSPTRITWTLPPGVTAGDIQWPLPEKLPPAEVTTYGYENEVVLLAPMKLTADLRPGPIDVKANVSWLECKDVCVPASEDIQATLTVGATKTSPDAATIELWKQRVPLTAAEYPWSARVWWQPTTNQDQRMINIEGSGTLKEPWNSSDRADFFPDANDAYIIQGPTEILPAQHPGANFILRKAVQKLSGDWPKVVTGVLVEEDAGERTAFEVKLPVADTASPTASAAAVAPSVSSGAGQTPTATQPLWRMLLYAFIGGLILNVMPCVLPVIALKILGFVNEAKSEPRRVRVLGLIYALGVLASFLALAGIVIGVKAAGHQAGWGMQFGNPIFVVCLTTLVTLVALNLFGVFEVILTGRALDTAGELASRHGKAGAFFNGILATTLATPCTAPYLAAALGFAFAQSPGVIALIFLTVGAGLAAPYVLLSWNPAWLKLLPKPGPWMEKFKMAMGFPMLATVVWLYGIAGSSYGKNVLWLGVFLVIVAFAAWVFGEYFQRGHNRRGAALALVLILLAAGYGFALERELNWRTASPPAEAGSLKESADGIDWQPWSPEAVAAARAAGRPVLVDFTADWCLTCQVNKKTSIEIAPVRRKIKELGVVALLADDTHTPENISRELTKYNSAGVPLVLVYPKNSSAEPVILPALLTPGIVLNALETAAK